MLVRKDSKVVAVDGSRMALFKNVGEAFAPVLELIEEHKNPSLRTSELGTDKPGRSFQSKSPRRGTHEITDLQQLEEDRFVTEAAEKIETIVANTKAGVVLVAAPRALGVIRKNLKPETKLEPLLPIIFRQMMVDRMIADVPIHFFST